jgi:hypothetical protein
MVVSLRSAQPCVGLHLASALAVGGGHAALLNSPARPVEASGGPEQVTLPTRATHPILCSDHQLTVTLCAIGPLLRAPLLLLCLLDDFNDDGFAFAKALYLFSAWPST